VISRLLNWGVRLRVANGGLQLVYDTPIELLEHGKLDAVETLLVVLMGLVESGGQVGGFSCWVELWVYRGRDPAGEEADGSFFRGGRAGCEDWLCKISNVDDDDKAVARRSRDRDRTIS
jgi:hypothetical protein